MQKEKKRTTQLNKTPVDPTLLATIVRCVCLAITGAPLHQVGWLSRLYRQHFASGSQHRIGVIVCAVREKRHVTNNALLCGNHVTRADEYEKTREER